MHKIIFPILILTTAFLVNGCSSSSSNSAAYSCSLPCLQEAPVISTSSISSATGGPVDVTITFSGNITDIRRVDIFLRDINSGNSADTVIVYSPAQQTITVSLNVSSGTPVSSYYPFITLFTNTSNTSSQYYRDASASTDRYAYYEITNGNASSIMISPFNIPFLQVN